MGLHSSTTEGCPGASTYLNPALLKLTATSLFRNNTPAISSYSALFEMSFVSRLPADSFITLSGEKHISIALFVILILFIKDNQYI